MNQDLQRPLDCLVIGAGIVGSGVALELARAGHQVTVLDKLSGAGYGSTSSSSALIRFNYSTRSGVAMAWEGLHYWKDWAQYLGAREGGPADNAEPLAHYIRAGILLFKTQGTNEAAFEPLYEEFGVPNEMLSAAEVTKRWPHLTMERFGPPKRLEDDAFWAEPDGTLEGAFYTPDGGYISDPLLAAQNLASAAIRAGATFKFNTEVTAITRADGRVTGVTVDDGNFISADVVVNVAGPFSFAVNTMAGVLDDMTITPKPMRREVYVAPAPADLDYETHGVTFADLDTGIYTRGESGNNILIGGIEPECDPLEWIDDPDGASEILDQDEFQLHVLRSNRRIIGMGVPPTKKGIVGVYDVSEDWTPIYDRSNLDGFYMAIGTSGNQFKNGPIAGRCMAELIGAVEAGHDHDSDPVVVNGPHTGVDIDLGTFSRKRHIDSDAPATVLG